MPRRLVLAVLAFALAAAAGAWLYTRLHYYTAAEVDRAAFPLAAIDLPYPVGASGVQYEGRVEMKVYIDAEGGVDRVELLDAAVPAAYRDLALRAFRNARFGPALRGGRPVRSVKRIEVEFKPAA